MSGSLRDSPISHLRLIGDPEAGDTLIELLITVLIISLAAVALLAALTTSITSSTEHRQLSVDDTLLKSFADSTTYQLEHNTSAALFQNCATSLTYSDSYLGWTDPTQDNGYHTQVISVVYWNPSLNSNAGGFDTGFTQAQCNASPATDQGIQELIISAVAPNGLTLNLATVVRNPAFE